MSYSKINTYKGCPFSYFLGYGLGVIVPDNPALALGSMLHTHAKRFWDINYKSVDKFVGAFRGMYLQRVFGKLKNHQPVAFKYKDEPWIRLKQGEKMIELFYRQNIRNKEREKRPILLEKQVRAPFRGFRVLGKLDRVDELKARKKGPKKIIIDYKSDKIVPVDELEANFVYSSQFVIYRIIHKHEFKENADVYVWYLRIGRMFLIKPKPNDKNCLEKLLIEVTDDIKKDKFPMFKGFHCKSVCEYFKPICKHIKNSDKCILELERMIRKGKLKVSKNKWKKYLERKKLIFHPVSHQLL